MKGVRELRDELHYDGVLMSKAIAGDFVNHLATRMTEIGVDIIECNFYCPHMTGKA
jgi:dihydroorotate dehydrogenase